jgi:hypothetical protein
MGWTGVYQNHKKTTEEIQVFLENQFAGNFINTNEEHINLTPKMTCIRGGEVYMAFNLLKKDKAGVTLQEYVFAMVILIKNSNREFMYKDMDENMHPYAYKASKKFMKLLTPIKEIEKITGQSWKHAQEWRDGVNKKGGV